MTTALPSDAARRYSRIAVVLHWSIAALIMFNLAAGLLITRVASAYKNPIGQIHVSVGITVLALTVLRIVWRLLHSPPPFAATTTRWERSVAHLTHFLLYAAMVLMPLTGWAIVSAHPPVGSAGAAALKAAEASPGQSAKATGRRATYFWLVDLPPIAAVEEIAATPGGIGPQKVLHERFISWHALGACILAALLLLHVAGALKHQLFDRQPILWRMGFQRRMHLHSSAEGSPDALRGP